MPPRPMVGTRSAWRGDDPDTLMVEGMVSRAWLQRPVGGARLWGITVGRTSWSSVGPYEEATGARGGQTTLGHIVIRA